MRAMRDPSNSVPYYDLMVMGLRDLQTIFSEILTAMNKEMPEPRPYPFCSISSKRITMNPEAVNWMMINIAFPTPMSSIEP
jgi:hypothetical protein